MVNVYVADDHAMLRAGLKSILSEVEDIEIIGETDDTKHLIREIRQLEVDILLLDISMPGPGFLEILSRIRHVNDGLIKVLVLSTHPEEQYAIRAIKAGAEGYLTKENSPNELIKAIRVIYEGKRYISPSFAEILANDVVSGESTTILHDSLSSREYQILCLLGKGTTVTEIANSLSLSPKTISTYRNRLFKKLNFQNNADLIHYVIDNKLL